MTTTPAACSTTGSSPEPHPASTPARTEDTDETSTRSPAAGVPIILDIEGTAVTGTLFDTTAARSLTDQLPLELTFTDYVGQEKIADLPAPLSLEGMPAGDDAAPLTIGYYAPDQALVLYYDHVGYYSGIVRLGVFDDLEAVHDHDDAFTARLSRSD
ncbi:cyclophilin-like fold protein [Kocuria oceani]|uniref:cyclophilin-like fold protein n=1 Tax=Kocuria oceani TaxID=988827 RepID=UPI00403580ED